MNLNKLNTFDESGQQLIRANSGVIQSNHQHIFDKSNKSVERNAAASYGINQGHSVNISTFDVTQKIYNPPISFVQQEEGDFNKVSNIVRKKSVNNQSDFLQRFQDKQSFMNKDGPSGIVKNA